MACGAGRCRPGRTRLEAERLLPGTVVPGSVFGEPVQLQVVMRTARAIAVHNGRVAAELREQYSTVPVAAIRMGVAAFEATRGTPHDDDVEAHARVRRELDVPDRALMFAALGRVTAE